MKKRRSTLPKNITLTHAPRFVSMQIDIPEEYREEIEAMLDAEEAKAQQGASTAASGMNSLAGCVFLCSLPL